MPHFQSPLRPQATPSTGDPKKLLNYWHYLLSKKQYTKAQLISKAKLKKYAESVIEEVMEVISTQHLINDTLVAERVMSASSGIRGKRLLQIKLIQQQLTKTDIEQAVTEFEETLNPSQQQKILRKYGALTGYEKKSAIVGYLMRRGFVTANQLYMQYFAVSDQNR